MCDSLAPFIFLINDMEKKINNNPFTWNYSPAVETKEHIQINPQYNLFINGKFVESSARGEAIEVKNLDLLLPLA